MIKILVIDDNPDIIFTVKTSLESSNKKYKILGAEGGEKGLELALTKKPDIIILDIMMPDMVGWVVNKKLKEEDNTKNIPVIFLTARTDENCRKLGSFAGSLFMTKPFDTSELHDNVEKLVKTLDKNSSKKKSSGKKTKKDDKKKKTTKKSALKK